MTDFKGFIGAAKRLDDIDLPKLGARIGVGEDEIHALIEVETAGGGFDKIGRPRLLFEPHVFYRNLTGSKRDEAVRAGLAYPKWGTKAYPKDSYSRLLRAIEIDETAALKSASWGLGQILGENHKMVGYATPQAMVLAFMADEENHLSAMVEFIKGAHIDDDLKAHRWAVVARVYNGPGYAANHYDTKLAAAYAKWAKIKDTPWTSGSDTVAPQPQVSDQPVIPDTPPPVMPKPAVAPPGMPPNDPSKVPGGVVAGGGALAMLAGVFGHWWWLALGIVAVAIVIGLILHNRK